MLELTGIFKFEGAQTVPLKSVLQASAFWHLACLKASDHSEILAFQGGGIREQGGAPDQLRKGANFRSLAGEMHPQTMARAIQEFTRKGTKKKRGKWPQINADENDRIIFHFSFSIWHLKKGVTIHEVTRNGTKKKETKVAADSRG
ncbi:MAG TPA: hypothetical protein VJ023_04490 [Pyrinomonadaceae bacterium]|nr:hypothetical protein [Pyrinomonadaceae bacterium]